MSDIDCVILWVDGSDPKWIAEKNKYMVNTNNSKEDAEGERFRDWDILKYLFRGIEKNAGWFRKVFFVTCGQKPAWLNVNNKKLVLVDHKDFIPDEYLPTFSSHTIELNLYRIKDLSEKFVYFNDDMFIMRKTKTTDFFHKDLPCDSAVLNAFSMKKTDKEFRFLMPLNNIAIINKYFNKKSVLKHNIFKYFNLKYGVDVLRTLCLLPWIHFTGFLNYHLPYSLKKETFREIWTKEYETLNKTCLHKFRNSEDVNIWLMLYWQYAKGDFFPRSPKIGCEFGIVNDDKQNQTYYKLISSAAYKLMVVNDNVTNGDYKKIKKELQTAFNHVYPDKCSFEI